MTLTDGNRTPVIVVSATWHIIREGNPTNQRGNIMNKFGQVIYKQTKNGSYCYIKRDIVCFKYDCSVVYVVVSHWTSTNANTCFVRPDIKSAYELYRCFLSNELKFTLVNYESDDL